MIHSITTDVISKEADDSVPIKLSYDDVTESCFIEVEGNTYEADVENLDGFFKAFIELLQSLTLQSGS